MEESVQAVEDENETERSANKRLKLQNEVDRISDLPDALIHHILSFLPSTKQAIRTGILSKRWKNQWTCVPVLIFYFSRNQNFNFSQCIKKTLALHDSPKIHKFHIKYRDPRLPPKGFILPKFLFNNAFFVKLELTNCHLTRKWNPNWPCLKEFKLDSLTSRFSAIQNVISRSPLLESLQLTSCGAVYGHAIVSKSLKRLSFVYVNSHDKTKHLGISCPNLEELSIVSSAISVTSNLIRPMIENALSGSPLLRLLEVRYFVCHVLVVASRSLKKLVLNRNHISCAIEIVCPSLEELNLYDLDIASLKVVNLPSSVGVDRDVTVSKSVKRLSIVNATFDDIDNRIEILWPNLMALMLGSTNLACRTIENVLDGCPLLRSLELRNFSNDQLVIASNSLKKLVLEENTGYCAIKISCPNLEELKLDDLDIESLIVMDLPSSATVDLDFYARDLNASKQIVEQFQHVEKLNFGSKVKNVLKVKGPSSLLLS